MISGDDNERAEGEANANGKGKPGAEAPGMSPFLVGSLATLLGLLGALQITNDLVGKMARNEAGWTAAMFGLIVVAIGLGAATIAVPGRTNTLILGFIGVGFVVAAMLIAIKVALNVHGVEDTPLVNAKVLTDDGAARVEMTVNAAGIENDEVMHIQVRGVRFEAGSQAASDGVTVETVYNAAVGPTVNGTIDETIATPLPSSQATHVQARAWIGDKESKSCLNPDARQDRTGCVILELSPGRAEPHVTASLANSGQKPAIIDVTVEVAGAARPPVFLTVGNFGRKRRPFFVRKISPGTARSAPEKFAVYVPPSVKVVCVSAARARPIAHPRRRCTTKDRAQSWVRLQVP